MATTAPFIWCRSEECSASSVTISSLAASLRRKQVCWTCHLSLMIAGTFCLHTFVASLRKFLHTALYGSINTFNGERPSLEWTLPRGRPRLDQLGEELWVTVSVANVTARTWRFGNHYDPLLVLCVNEWLSKDLVCMVVVMEGSLPSWSWWKQSGVGTLICRVLIRIF